MATLTNVTVPIPNEVKEYSGKCVDYAFAASNVTADVGFMSLTRNLKTQLRWVHVSRMQTQTLTSFSLGHISKM